VPLTAATTRATTAASNPSIADELAAEFAPILARAQLAGTLGPGDVGTHVLHAAVYLEAWPPLADARTILDLGSGAGIPGLVLARMLPTASVVLLDGSTRRAAALSLAVGGLGLAARVSVVAERAEVAAHRPQMRGRFDVVVARAFGKPAVTAECGAGFLMPTGVLIISEPPEQKVEQRWPATGLARLGLEIVEASPSAARFVVLRAVQPLDDRYPRRAGVPAKRPLF
jgi:16S rRNA (guanine527-N7)-methyltransferase